MRTEAKLVIQQLREGMSLYVAGSVSEPTTLLSELAEQPALARGIHVTTPYVPGLNRLIAQAFSEAASVTLFMLDATTKKVFGDRVIYRPLPWSGISTWLRSQSYDAGWFQTCAPNEYGFASLGLGADFIHEVVPNCKQVVLEVNSLLPETRGHEWISVDSHTTMVRSNVSPLQLPPLASDRTTMEIARHTASSVRDGDTIQIGVGSLSGAVLRELKDHRYLGFHSGIASDEVFELIEKGAMDGSRKSLDRGVAVAAGVAGGDLAHEALRMSDSLLVRPSSYTHDEAVLAAQKQFTAINGALEVDLSGQVNVEEVGNRRLSSPGGFPDFVRGAKRSEGGRALVLLPSTTTSGKSRIVPNVSGPVAAGVTDGVTVITEYGVADLEGKSTEERASALVHIAAPEHQDMLQKSIYDSKHR